jgi:predicted RNase H-like nuclease
MPAPLMRSAGLDGCRAGWVCIGWDGRKWAATVFASLAQSLAYVASGARVCIDMPVGLSETGLRACDQEARRLLGPRRSSVFAAPPSFAMQEMSYAELNRESKRRYGRGISKQAFYLLPKIRETARHLQDHRDRCQDWREVHPELCFAALQGGVPLSENKKTQAGYRQRMAILSARLGARAVTRLIDKLDAHPLRAGVSRDDILDAMVCGYVARLDSNQLRALPAGDVERNERGDAMQIWFPSA